MSGNIVNVPKVVARPPGGGELAKTDQNIESRLTELDIEDLDSVIGGGCGCGGGCGGGCAGGGGCGGGCGGQVVAGNYGCW